MKQLLKNNNNKKLILLFTGWGCDENLFNRKTKKGYDYMICFDYENIDFKYQEIQHYDEIFVIAWSMGVWVANTILSNEETQKLNIKMSVAFNGTPFPIDDTKGIPKEIFKGTLDNFSEKTLAKFRRRICGDTENTKEFLSHMPYRDTKSLLKELSSLWNITTTCKINNIYRWDYAIISKADKIFPSANQLNFWKEIKTCKISEIEAEHYSTNFFNDILINLEESEFIKQTSTI